MVRAIARTVRTGRGVRRDLHLPHAQRGRPVPRVPRRAARDQLASRMPDRGVPPQGSQTTQLAQDATGDRPNPTGTRLGPTVRGQHVPLPCRRHLRWPPPSRHASSTASSREVRQAFSTCCRGADFVVAGRIRVVARRDGVGVADPSVSAVDALFSAARHCARCRVRDVPVVVVA